MWTAVITLQCGCKNTHVSFLFERAKIREDKPQEALMCHVSQLIILLNFQSGRLGDICLFCCGQRTRFKSFLSFTKLLMSIPEPTTLCPFLCAFRVHRTRGWVLLRTVVFLWRQGADRLVVFSGLMGPCWFPVTDSGVLKSPWITVNVFISPLCSARFCLNKEILLLGA